VLKILSRFNLVQVLDLSKYHSVLLKDTIGWEAEKRNVRFHKKSSRDHDNFERQLLNGCKPEKSNIPKWKDPHPLKGCVEKEVWDMWNEAAYFGENSDSLIDAAVFTCGSFLRLHPLLLGTAQNF
jgi:hypothetical protein